ncbi:MAG: ATP synthase F1 subunit delta [Alphaproteobacteria bacterium]|nr:ATP synthase F1 subunit delta [Alphaproteobacteria bacterium]
MSSSSADYRLIAARYAQALFDLALEKKQLDAVKKDLDAVAEAYANSEDFRRLSESPALTREEKIAGIEAILSANKASQLTRDFFRTLAENSRLAVTSYVVSEFNKRLAESRNEATAQVTSAYALSAKEVKQLQDALKKATGRDAIHVVTKEDPEILGGVIIHVDGKMFDNSIASKINRLASAMKTQVQA